MKKFIHNLTLCFIVFCVLTSCNQGTELFENKYIKGTVIALAKDNEIGFVEMNNDHDQSYLAMYHQKDNKDIALSLYDSVYFKVSNYKDIPIAYNLKENLASDDEEYLALPKTGIRYHAFYDHSQTQGFHKIGHLRPGFVGTLNADGFYPIKVFVMPRNNEAIFLADEARKQKAISLGEGIVYVQANNDNIILDIDTCHMHGSHVIECRQDLN